MRTLVLGGARSGKSTHAEQMARDAERTGRPVTYLATSKVRTDDPEWAERIALHRARRPERWQTLETTDIATELLRDDDALLLVDCLAVWITRMMDESGIWTEEPDARELLAERVDELVDALENSTREVVLVSNEVGLSVVPASFSGRFFRDQLGALNMRVAARCEQVLLCVAGIPVTVKAP